MHHLGNSLAVKEALKYSVGNVSVLEAGGQNGPFSGSKRARIITS
jgi:hypothetical protein